MIKRPYHMGNSSESFTVPREGPNPPTQSPPDSRSRRIQHPEMRVLPTWYCKERGASLASQTFFAIGKRDIHFIFNAAPHMADPTAKKMRPPRRIGLLPKTWARPPDLREE